MTIEFIELRRRSANSRIVITRLTTCRRTSPFIPPRTRLSAIADPTIDIVYIPSRTDTTTGGSSISASLGYLGMTGERRASRIPRISAAIRELISTCPPAIRLIHVVDISRYEHFSCRRYREGDRGRIACSVLLDNIASVSFQA